MVSLWLSQWGILGQLSGRTSQIFPLNYILLLLFYCKIQCNTQYNTVTLYITQHIQYEKTQGYVMSCSKSADLYLQELENPKSQPRCSMLIKSICIFHRNKKLAVSERSEERRVGKEC